MVFGSTYHRTLKQDNLQGSKTYQKKKKPLRSQSKKSGRFVKAGFWLPSWQETNISIPVANSADEGNTFESLKWKSKYIFPKKP